MTTLPCPLGLHPWAFCRALDYFTDTPKLTLSGVEASVFPVTESARRKDLKKSSGPNYA